MQAFKYQDEIFTTQGNVVPGAIVTVYLAGTSTLATLYANSAGSAGLVNPVVTNYSGYFYFYAASGTYDLVITGTGITQIIYTDVTLGGSGIAGQFVVDGTTYTTIQAAITAAGTTGSVTIPSSYAGTDTYTNPNGIQIVDLRRTPSGAPSRYRGVINMLTDCGLKGDGVTDDSTAAQTCFNNFQGHRFFFPQTQSGGACSYKFNSTLFPKGEGTTIAGESAGFKNSTSSQGGTVLCFATGVSGIELDLTGSNCSGCNIQDISLKGAEGTNFLVTPTLLNIPSGANLPLYKRTITSIQRASNVLTVNTSRVAGIEGLTQQVGSTVLISGVVSDTTMNGRCVVTALSAGSGTTTNPTQLTCNQNGSDAGPFAEGTIGLPTTGASSADGIRLCTNFATIKNVVIANFGRHGLNADSSAANGMCPTPFSDDLVLRDSVLINNHANGYLCNGLDCNAHLLSGNAVYYNVLWGIEDQSSLGNTHIGNQLSNGGHLWAASTQPTTKNISTIARTLSGGVSTVTVVLSQADANLKLGSCVVIAGVTDSSFNTTAGQCFFINSFTDSTHYAYEQPGAPANASSSGGTSRMAKFSEAYLSSGVDDGAQKIGTQAGVAQPVITNQYVEGGQGCKFSNNVILIGGANTPGCATTDDWKGRFLTTQGVAPAGNLWANLGGIANERDATNSLFLKAGLNSGTVRHFFLRWLNNNTQLDSWGLDVDPAGTSGDTGSIVWSRGTAGSGQRRLSFFGSANANGITRLSSESTGAVQINLDSNSGTGGLAVASGGASPAIVATIDATGLGTFNGGVKGGPSGSIISDSRELIQSAHSCGTTTACANTSNGSNRMIFGRVALSSGSPSTATITGISPAFTSTATYGCSLTNETTQANSLKASYVSGSSFTITGPNTVTDSVWYQCVGS